MRKIEDGTSNIGKHADAKLNEDVLEQFPPLPKTNVLSVVGEGDKRQLGCPHALVK